MKIIRLCVAWFVMAQGAYAAPTPRLVCDQPVHDFGEAVTDTVVTHAFVIRNEGRLSARIRDIKASCGCTRAFIESKTIAAGETRMVEVELNLRNRFGDQAQYIVVESDDPVNPTLMLTLKGRVRRELEIYPSTVLLGRLAPGAAVTRTVQVTSARPLVITRVESDHPALKATVTDMDKGQSFQLEIQVLAPQVAGPLLGYVRLHTDHPRYPVVRVTVSGVVGPPTAAVEEGPVK
jgi:hypothetical protein